MKVTNIIKSKVIPCASDNLVECPVTIYLVEFTESYKRTQDAARFMVTWVRTGINLREILPDSAALTPAPEFYRRPESPWASPLSAHPWNKNCPTNFYPMINRQKAEKRYWEMVEIAEQGKTKFEVNEEIWL
jgi:hypothetical protein